MPENIHNSTFDTPQTVADLHVVVRDELARHGRDHRTCYVSIAPEPPAAEVILVECSDDEVLRDVRAAVAKGGIDATRIRWAPLPGRATPHVFVSSSSVADVRREPAHTAELVTQAIQGEALEPLKVAGDWHLVRLEDGYIGWVRSWHLTTIARDAYAAFLASASHRVKDNVIQVFEAADEDSLPVTDAVVGTRIAARAGGKRGWRQVTLADGRCGFAKARSIEALPRSRRISREGLAASGMRFLGIPYLWGGNSTKGFDCSGLVQRIYHLHGVSIPRDSDLQALVGQEKGVGSVDGLETGDLLFFGKDREHITHVAMYLSNGLFLHAYGQVKVGSLEPAHPLFEAKLAADWQVTRDPAR